MKKLMRVLLLVLVISSPKAHSQCNPEWVESIPTNIAGLSYLKTYTIPVHEIKDVPFAREYSYVFTKGTTYTLYLVHEPNSMGLLDFTLRDSNGNIRNDELVKVNKDGNEMMTFKCTATGIYYFILHTKQSLKGCAVMQLLYSRHTQVSQSCDAGLTKKLSKPIDKKFSLLKEYSIEEGQEKRFSYVFTKGTTYNIYVEGKTKGKNGINVHILNSEKQPLARVQREELSDGINFRYECKHTGIYYFDFDLSQYASCAVAQLSYHKIN
jgi:hypothetical protein